MQQLPMPEVAGQRMRMHNRSQIDHMHATHGSAKQPVFQIVME
jgi:hypothetical protein